MKLTLVIIFFALAGVVAIIGKHQPALTVTAVRDGDTIELSNGQVIRLYGIDAPEKGQPYGKESTDNLKELVEGQKVSINSESWDRYGRLVARVGRDGSDMSNEQLRDGMAWHYTQYSDSKLYERSEREARDAGLGLWADPNPVPPWKWRKEPGK